MRDHDHLNGEYRGAAHSKCNQQLRIDAYHTPIPVFFHKLKNFDAHHLISAVGRRDEKTTTSTDKDGVQKMKKDKNGKDTNEPRKVTDGGISAIVQNMEKMISFNDLLQPGQFRFLDSYAFLSSSLDRLVGNTPKEDLRITKPDYPTRSSMAREWQQERFELVTRTGKRVHAFVGVTPTITWTRLIDLTKTSYHHSPSSTVVSAMKVSQTRITNTPKRLEGLRLQEPG